jgi:hypothetical protein
MSSVRLLHITDSEKVINEFKQMDMKKKELNDWLFKNIYLVIKITNARGITGNVIKQLMLSSGGDCIVKDRGLLPEDQFVSMLITGSIDTIDNFLKKANQKVFDLRLIRNKTKILLKEIKKKINCESNNKKKKIITIPSKNKIINNSQFDNKYIFIIPNNKKEKEKYIDCVARELRRKVFKLKEENKNIDNYIFIPTHYKQLEEILEINELTQLLYYGVKIAYAPIVWDKNIFYIDEPINILLHNNIISNSINLNNIIRFKL